MTRIVFEVFDDELFCLLLRKPRHVFETFAVFFFLRHNRRFAFFQRFDAIDEFLIALFVVGSPLIEELLFFIYAGFIALYFGPSFSVFPFLLVSFPNEFIFCIEQNFFFLCFSFSNCILFYTFSFLF